MATAKGPKLAMHSVYFNLVLSLTRENIKVSEVHKVNSRITSLWSGLLVTGTLLSSSTPPNFRNMSQMI